MSDQTLKEFILQTVDDHSGGIKFIELITILLANEQDLNCTKEDLGGSKSLNTEKIFQEIREIPELDVLTYSMKLDENTFREKHFVYRK